MSANLDLHYTNLVIKKQIIPNYSYIYSSTNENLKKIFSEIDVSSKDALCVAASGDQAFYFLNNGVGNIDLFDINKLTLHYFYLRMWFIKYLDVFYPHVYNYDKKQMKKLLDLVVPETLEESYYYSYQYNFVKKFSEKKGDLIFRKVWECDDYNNIEDLSNLREKFNEFKFDFYNVDFSSEVDTSKKYDIIYVSNIVDWLRNKKIDITLYAENLNRLLKEDGFAIGTNVVYSSYGGSDMDILGKYFECVPFKSIDERYCGKRSPGYCLIRKQVQNE